MATIAIGIAPKTGGGISANVPVDALSQDGVPPEQGDDVSFSVDGTVQSVTGSTARVKINAIDGNPVGAGGGGAEPGDTSGVDDTGGGSSGLSGMSASDLGARLKKGAKGRPMPLM
jgi:hypothetical protein